MLFFNYIEFVVYGVENNMKLDVVDDKFKKIKFSHLYTGIYVLYINKKIKKIILIYNFRLINKTQRIFLSFIVCFLVDSFFRSTALFKFLYRHISYFMQ